MASDPSITAVAQTDTSASSHDTTMHHVDVLIIGGGISGLSVAWHLLQEAKQAVSETERPFPTVKILCPPENRGGWVGTSLEEDGFMLERGPHTLLGHHPVLQDILNTLNLSPVVAHPQAKKRFITLGHRLCPAPVVALQAMGIVGWGKWFLKQCTMLPESSEATALWSVSDWGRRRFSQKVVDTLLAPLCSGIYAGDPETLGFQDTFQALARLEALGSGSLVKGFFKAQYQKLQAKQAASRHSNTVGKVPYQIISFPQGLGMLADALHQSIEQTSPERLHQSPSEGATHITWEANQKTWHVTSADGVQWQTQCLVMACQLPSWETLLEPVLGQYPEALAAYKEVKTQTPYSSLAIVQLGVHGTALAHTLKGFGALVSRSKDRSEKSLRLLGSLWPSSMFPHRSPEGYHLLANFYGGAMDAEVLTWDDEALIQKCLEELHCLGILKSPVYASARYKLVRVHRAHQAIPQSTVGHRQRVANLKSVLSSYYAHHFHMVGSWSHGVSVTDCLAAGKATAHTLWQHLSQHDEDPPLPH